MSSPGSADAAPIPEYAGQEPPARVVANSTWSIFGQGTATVLVAGVGIYAVRSFSTVSWGHYSTALALVTLFAAVAGAGLGPLVLRDATSARDREDHVLGVSLQALGWMSCVAVVALAAVLPALGYPRQVLVLVVILGPLLLLNPMVAVLASAFNARSRLMYVAWFQLAQAFVYGVLAIAAIASSLGVTGLSVATVAAALVGAGLGLWLVRRKLGMRPNLRQPPRLAWSFLRAAIPFGAIGIIGIVYDRVDTLMLYGLSNATSVAHYTVPYGFLRLSWILPSVVSAAFYPLLSRTIASSSREAEHLFFLVVRALVFISLPAALLLTFASPDLMPFVFGQRYAASVAVLQILAWTLVLSFPNYALWYGIVAVRQERRAFLITLGGLTVNVAVNAVAIPKYGSSGAAAALVVSEVAVLLGQAVLVNRTLFPIPVVQILAKPLAAGIVVVPLAALLSTRSTAAAALGGATAYVAAMIAVSYVAPAEWRPVFDVLGRPLLRLRRGG